MIKGYVRQLVAEGWQEQAEGKGVLLSDPSELKTWRLLMTGGPHHSDVIEACEIELARIDAYLLINPDGQFHIGSRPKAASEDSIAARVTEHDPRLRLDDESSWGSVFG